MKRWKKRKPSDEPIEQERCDAEARDENASHDASQNESRSESQNGSGAEPQSESQPDDTFGNDQLPSRLNGEELRKLALSPGLQSLWGAILPALGVLPSRPGEYPGIFKVESGPGDGEATIYIDLPDQPYEYGKPSTMDRVVTVNVKLDHDYRLLGGRYYCVDCESPSDEAGH